VVFMERETLVAAQRLIRKAPRHCRTWRLRRERWRRSGKKRQKFFAKRNDACDVKSGVMQLNPITTIPIGLRSKSLHMLEINRRRDTEAIESMVRSAKQIASSMETIAACERERIGWLRQFFGELFARTDESQSDTATRRYGDGGMRSGAESLPPRLPPGPGGIPALPDAQNRPCINVTPPKAEKTRRKWLW
jgi:hypothetical protein